MADLLLVFMGDPIRGMMHFTNLDEAQTGFSDAATLVEKGRWITVGFGGVETCRIN